MYLFNALLNTIGYHTLYEGNESAKDPDFGLKHPSKSTSEVIGVVKFDLFKQWASTTHESRDEEYLALKEEITERYRNAFYLHFPQTRQHFAEKDC